MTRTAPIAIPICSRESSSSTVDGILPATQVPLCMTGESGRFNPIAAALADGCSDDDFYVGRPRELIAEETSWAVAMTRRCVEGYLVGEVDRVQKQSRKQSEATASKAISPLHYGQKNEMNSVPVCQSKCAIIAGCVDVKESGAHQADGNDAKSNALALNCGAPVLKVSEEVLTEFVGQTKTPTSVVRSDIFEVTTASTLAQ